MRSGLLIGGAVTLSVAALLVIRFAGTDHAAVPARKAAGNSHASFTERLRSADLSTGAHLFGQCAACHSTGRDGADLEGPNLYGVVGSGVAERRSRYAYTAALRRSGGAWTFQKLDAWLTDPAAFAPGTRMAFGGLSDPQERADVIAYLNSQGSNFPLP